MYTLNFLENNWFYENRYYFSNLVVCESEGYDIDNIIFNILDFISKYSCQKNDYKIAINESIWDKLMAKNKKDNGLEPSEYVAIKTKYNYKSAESFYDTKTEIGIEVSPGIFEKGIIRISNHPVDLTKWAENNSKYDFGISFVLEEKDKAIVNNEIVDIDDRIICIYEFTYKTNRNNFSFLNNLILEILDLKKNKKFLPCTTLFNGKHANIVTNKILESISKAIKKALN